MTYSNNFTKTMDLLKRRGLIRMHCDITPESRKCLHKIAIDLDLSVRELVQNIFDEYIQNYDAELEKRERKNGQKLKVKV